MIGWHARIAKGRLLPLARRTRADPYDQVEAILEQVLLMKPIDRRLAIVISLVDQIVTKKRAAITMGETTPRWYNLRDRVVKAFKVHFPNRNDDSELNDDRKLIRLVWQRLRPDKKDIYISYKHGEGDDKGPFIEQAKKTPKRRRISLRIDHDCLFVYESICRFMDEIGQSSQCIVFLSDGYLRSRYCLTELMLLYQEHQDNILQHVVVVNQIGQELYKDEFRNEIADFWKDNFKLLEWWPRETREKLDYAPNILRKRDEQQRDRIEEFTKQLNEVFTQLQDAKQEVIDGGNEFPSIDIAAAIDKRIGDPPADDDQ